MKKNGARDLKVFRMAYALSLDIHRASLAWPKTEQFGGIADQFRRASKSVNANLIEGYEKYASKKEAMRFLDMAKGSVAESMLWCDYVRDLGYEPSARCAEWQEQLEETSRMLVGLKKWFMEQSKKKAA